MRPRTSLIPAATAAAVVALASPVALAGGCPEDLDGSGTVDFPDLLSLLAQWGDCDTPCTADFDGSGAVDFPDLLQLLAAFDEPCESGPVDAIPAELAGERLLAGPWFRSIRTQTEFDVVSVAPPADLLAAFAGQEVDLFVVDERSAADWEAPAPLVDVRGSSQAATFPGTGGAADVVDLDGLLGGEDGIEFGRGYDLVVDVDRNGLLSDGDLVDGLGDEAGFHVVGDTTLEGPLEVATALANGGTFRKQIIRYPTSGGPYPLVVISHGNGHNYLWYAYLQFHLASWGYVTMSHENNTQPGIETASLTTLENTDYLLGNLGTIAGGALDGLIDTSRIIWIGHSRGGEGVVRAYDRIRDGLYNPTNYDLEDIALVSSIAPTDFLGTGPASPIDVTYHLIYGSADGDVHGGADCQICQSFSLYERALGYRASTYVQGADHNDFNSNGFNDYCAFGGSCSGALAIGREEAQRVARAAYLALIKHFVDGDPAAKDFLFRQYEDLKPIGVAATTIVDREYRDGPAAGAMVIDDYQSNTSLAQSSSGGTVTASVSNRAEGRLDDGNSTFTWTASDPFNGMTRGRNTDSGRGTVFDWIGDAFLEFEVPAGSRDLTAMEALSWRSCQGTRHPRTTSETGDVTYAVTLRDEDGETATLRLDAFGGGAEEPFVRGGQGSGTGWANEFETHRFTLTQFARVNGALDLSRIEAIRFDFGPSFGASQGRLGFDDLEVVPE